jgi:hypothetical protein
MDTLTLQFIKILLFFDQQFINRKKLQIWTIKAIFRGKTINSKQIHMTNQIYKLDRCLKIISIGVFELACDKLENLLNKNKMKFQI